MTVKKIILIFIAYILNLFALGLTQNPYYEVWGIINLVVIYGVI